MENVHGWIQETNIPIIILLLNIIFNWPFQKLFNFHLFGIPASFTLLLTCLISEKRASYNHNRKLFDCWHIFYLVFFGPNSELNLS